MIDGVSTSQPVPAALSRRTDASSTDIANIASRGALPLAAEVAGSQARSSAFQPGAVEQSVAADKAPISDDRLERPPYVLRFETIVRAPENNDDSASSEAGSARERAESLESSRLAAKERPSVQSISDQVRRFYDLPE